jgi:hypothetical protein
VHRKFQRRPPIQLLALPLQDEVELLSPGLLAWAGTHAYEDVRAQLYDVVFANDAKEGNRPCSIRQAPLRGAAPFLGTPLTNRDILKLRAAGLEEQLIIDVTQAFPASFALDANGIVELKRAGLTDAIIRGMIQEYEVE